MEEIELSVVLPTYNEAERLPPTLDEVLPYLEEKYPQYEVIVVDDNSPDGTGKYVAELAEKNERVRLITQPGRLGKGAALRRGCVAAKGRYVLFMDADHSTPITEVEKFIPHVEAGKSSMVAGVRCYQEEESWHRRVIGILGQLLAHLIVFRRGVVDSQCGFKLFTREAVSELFPYCRVNGGMIDVELFYIMHRKGIRSYFEPVSWDNKADSKINVLLCIVRDPLDMLKIRLRGMSKAYDVPLKDAQQPWSANT